MKSSASSHEQTHVQRSLTLKLGMDTARKVVSCVALGVTAVTSNQLATSVGWAYLGLVPLP